MVRQSFALHVSMDELAKCLAERPYTRLSIVWKATL
jgi:hypothetical protein